MNLDQALDMLMRGETKEQYKNRQRRLRELTTERDFLIDKLDLLEDEKKIETCQKRLDKVLSSINELV